MTNKINIGIMGCADVANRLVIPNILLSDKFNIVAIASRTIEKANELAIKFSCDAIVGYENLLLKDNVDAVYIPLPTGLHYEWIIKSLQAGKHVLAEKSIACDYNEVDEIIQLARKYQLCVFENFMFPFHSQFEFVREMIAKKIIGEMQLLRSSFGFPIVNAATNIRYKKEIGGGSLLDAGAYTLMGSQYFLGFKQEVLSSSLEYQGQEVDFQGSVMLKNRQGIVSQLAFGFNNYYQNNIEIWGTKGKLTMERAYTSAPGFKPKVIIETQNNKEVYELPADNHFVNILKKFYDCILNKKFDYQYEQILNQSRLLTQVINQSKF